MFLTAFLPLLMPSPIEAVMPSVAYVRADPDGVGSGVLVDRERRLLLTCRHVVGDRKSTEVFFPWMRDGRLETDREEYLRHREELRTAGLLRSAKVLRTSNALDLALLQLDALPIGVKEVPLADDRVRVGERVVSVGHRADLPTLWNVSLGGVRQTGRLTDGYDWRAERLAENAPAMLLQLPVEEGDSGGPVLNARGELVAVVSGLRRRAPLAAIGIRSDAIRSFITAEPLDSHRDAPPDSQQRLLLATVWVRPSATNVRCAGVVIDARRRLVLTSAEGVGPLVCVGVAFPRLCEGSVDGERDAYADPVTLHTAKCWAVGRVLHRDPDRDLALVQLDTIPEGVGAIPLAESEPTVGDGVSAVSHPTGAEFVFTYSFGSVKQHGRFALHADGRRAGVAVLQLPAQSTSPGGPIVNSAGQLVGVQASVVTPQFVTYSARLQEVRTFLAEAHLAGLVGRLKSFVSELDTVKKYLAWYELSRGDAESAVRYHPRCVPALLAVAAAHPDQTTELDQVLFIDPQHRGALFRRAGVWLRKNEPRKATADLDRILDVHPADTAARLRFAAATAASGLEARAAAEFANVLRVDSGLRAAVSAAVFAHAEELERKGVSRAADWLTLALGTVNTVLKDDAIRSTLEKAAGVSDDAQRLKLLRDLK